MTINKFLLIFSILFIFSCASSKILEKIVLIETRLGSIKVKLYNDTPNHRDNFIKLVNSGFYDSLLFHRVIHDFMIQGGDPDSRNAPSNRQLGTRDAGYTLPAEIRTVHFHKRGAIAAAREGDEINPDHKSSGSQFYLVQGKKYTRNELSDLEQKINQTRFQAYFNKNYLHIADSILKKNSHIQPDSLKNIAFQTTRKSFQEIRFTQDQLKAYQEIGGVPHLDGAYTVFGEVIEGFDVLEKISLLATDSNDRPLTDIKMHVKVIQ